MEVDMQGAENEEPEMSFRRGYQQGVIDIFCAIERCVDPATREVLQAWIEKDVSMWRAKAMLGHPPKKELYGVKKNVLVVAQKNEVRARIARVLHSAGYGAELPGNQKRALELAARKDIQAAIVVHSTDLVGLGQKLRVKIPTTILVGHRTDQIVRPGNSLQGTDASLDEQKLLDRLSEPAASPG